MTTKITRTGGIKYGMKSVHLRPSGGPAIERGRTKRIAIKIRHPVEVITDLKVASSLIAS